MKKPTSKIDKPWIDPVKGIPAKESTMNARGDFGYFTDLMRKVVHAPQIEKRFIVEE